MGTIMCFCNRLLVTKFVNIPFKIGSLLGCLLCVEHSSENAQVQGQKMNEKAANAQRKSWLTIAFKIWICNYLRFTAISSTAIKLKFRKRPFNSDVPNIQQSQVCEIIQSWTLDTEIKRFREAFFFSLFFFANGSCHTNSISPSIVTFTILLLTTVRHCSLTSHSTQR